MFLSFRRSIADIEDTDYLGCLSSNDSFLHKVFRMSHLEIFARACGAHSGILVEIGASFQLAPISTSILQSGPRAGRFAAKATDEHLLTTLAASEYHFAEIALLF